MQQRRIDVNVINHGHSALSYATLRGHADIVKALLEVNADVNMVNNVSEWRKLPIHLATDNGHTEILQVLLQHPDTNVDCCNTFGWTPLVQAIVSCRYQAVDMLLQAGADIRNANEVYGVSGSLFTEAIICHLSPNRISKKDLGSMFCKFYAAGGTITRKQLDEITYNGHITIQFIKDDQNELGTLSSLCRRQIRSHLLKPDGGNQKNLIVAVPKLPLPKKLIKFILFDEEIANECF